MKAQGFSKDERLKSRKSIKRLIASGQRLQVPGLTLLWLRGEEKALGSVKVAFSVPKKKIPAAVDRNLIKRRLREAYRLNKKVILHSTTGDNNSLEMMFIYQENCITPFKEAEDKLVLLLTDLQAKLDEGSTKSNI